ncbi:inosine/xanthosine triphosphatase [Ferrimonas balearica]|uniref:inosine/xanthosine triphosphatase n=1 Tax=Ferrimonas balearica TaxID=44012 RepID=UPI001C94F0C3|nr:inosine/xanthosine triphosphatase [Ferrimonas balearica]MBY5981598.1 inosine/xanthosine triphosphatase [Ferrimonas balearica]
MSQAVVAVASHNPVKIRAAEQALAHSFADRPWQSRAHAVPSGVAEQPMNDEETRQGALNRLAALRQADPEADYYVAFEGGYDRLDGVPCTFAYVAVSDGHRTRVGRSAPLPLPPVIATRLEAGEELGPVMDDLFQQHNIKQRGGAIGILTGGLMDRASLYQDTLILQLAPFRFPELYPLNAE